MKAKRRRHYGVFTLPDTETGTMTDTETHEKNPGNQATQSECVSVSVAVQFEHIHTILGNPFHAALN